MQINKKRGHPLLGRPLVFLVRNHHRDEERDEHQDGDDQNDKRVALVLCGVNPPNDLSHQEGNQHERGQDSENLHPTDSQLVPLGTLSPFDQSNQVIRVVSDPDGQAKAAHHDCCCHHCCIPPGINLCNTYIIL